jgi:hypothetical protein
MHLIFHDFYRIKSNNGELDWMRSVSSVSARRLSRPQLVMQMVTSGGMARGSGMAGRGSTLK